MTSQNQINLLAPWHVVILRPRHQALGLYQAVGATSAHPICLPMIEIIPLVATENQVSEWLDLLHTTSLLIVRSANAVLFLPDTILEFLKTPRSPPIISMGRGTTALLNERAISVFHTAPPGSTSESLLKAPFLQSEAVLAKKIVILGTKGGRNILADTLRQRGSTLFDLSVYRQERPTYLCIEKTFSWNKPHCFVATSVGCLQNLVELFPVRRQSWLFSCPLIAASKRIATFAKEKGFNPLFIAKSPHDEDIILSLERMAKTLSLM